MIILHFHLQPQFIYELFHINFTSLVTCSQFIGFRDPGRMYQALDTDCQIIITNNHGHLQFPLHCKHLLLHCTCLSFVILYVFTVVSSFEKTKSSCNIQVPLHKFPSHPIIILILKETAGSNLVLHSIQPKLHLAYYITFPFSVYSDGADDYVMSPYLGNVCFASSEYRFCFTLYSFASLYVDTFGELCLSLFDFLYWTP